VDNVPTEQGFPRRFGEYLLLGEIGAGGMGVVFQAVHLPLNRPCALKLLRDGALASSVMRERFLNEIEAVAALHHPQIVHVWRAAKLEGQLFLEMELVEGGTLADRLESGALPARDAAALVAGLSRAVQHAHERGVLHRDLKPANILLDEAGSGPKLTDFGLARLLNHESDLTRTLAVLGTPAYMAPELASGEAREATIAADVYSLGAILYECLAGQPPFHAENVPALLRKVAEEAPSPEPLLRPRTHREQEPERVVAASAPDRAHVEGATGFPLTPALSPSAGARAGVRGRSG